MTGKPTRLAISMGDPAGVGPEIILQALAAMPDNVEVILYGDPGVLKAAADGLSKFGHPGPKPDRELDMVPVTVFAENEINFGSPSRLTGDASYRYVVMALRAVLKGEADALVTAPISKRWWSDAGHIYPGHTELLAEQTNTEKYAMMLAGHSLRVVPVTIHVPIKVVSQILSFDKVLDTIILVDRALKELFGVEKPIIACSGLNPHAGEDGRIGMEEKNIIEPAIEAASAKGIDVKGPLPADSMFIKKDAYDVAVCMYHDQALIPIKTLYPRESVNITLGLPIVRTSPDHGTAFNLAGTGRADPNGMIAAMKMAVEMVEKSQKP